MDAKLQVDAVLHQTLFVIFKFQGTQNYLFLKQDDLITITIRADKHWYQVIHS